MSRTVLAGPLATGLSLGVTTSALGAPAAAEPVVSSTVFVNELHCDNVGTGDAPDIRLVDAADGARGSGDSAVVHASRDGQTWDRVGQVDGTGSVDLGAIEAARYVKVVDATPDRGPRSVDGYDLDAVEVLSGCA